METIADLQLKIETATKELVPTADVSPGSVLHELLVKGEANAQLVFSQEITSVSQGATVSAALASATDTYSEAIDQIASNFDTYRNQGRKATGKIKVLVSANKTYYLPAGFSFTQPALTFDYITKQAYTIDSTGTSGVVVKPEGDQFYFIVPVEAKELTGDANVSNGTRFSPTTPAGVPEFISAVAYGNFTSGQSKETDKELIARFKTGMSTKNLLSSSSINSVMRDVAPNFRQASVIGIGDEEMTRNKHNLFGIGLPGMVDVYLRTNPTVATTKLSLTATKITSGPNINKWQLVLTANDVPGLYRVVSIIQSNGDYLGTQQILSTTYGLDLSVETRPNSITTVAEARFTRYQTCTIVFDYTAAASSAVFDVIVEGMPYIKEAQDLFLADASRIPGADYLVKAVVPCNVVVFLKIAKISPTQVVDTAGIKKEIFNYINNLAFGEAVYASNLINICHKYNIKQVELPILMSGTILVPSSSGAATLLIRDNDKLEIPNKPESGVTPTTTAFFIDYFGSTGKESIGVQLV